LYSFLTYLKYSILTIMIRRNIWNELLHFYSFRKIIAYMITCNVLTLSNNDCVREGIRHFHFCFQDLSPSKPELSEIKYLMRVNQWSWSTYHLIMRINETCNDQFQDCCFLCWKFAELWLSKLLKSLKEWIRNLECFESVSKYKLKIVVDQV
jgi:hypothetical protein